MSAAPTPYGHVRRTYEARTPASKQLFEAATMDLPGGETRTSTFFLPHPLFMERGEGQYLYDSDGHRYLDLLGNYTSLVHGHAHAPILTRIQDQLGRGSAHGACTRAQNELAALLKSRVPSLDRVRFTNSGTEAAMHAIRTARAATGRRYLVKMEGGYHGSWDGVLVGVKPPLDGADGHQANPFGPGLSPGAVEDTLVVPFNDPETATALIRARGSEIAAVIVEPMLGSCGAIPADPAFLRALRDVCDEIGALLIFDEIQTFRLAPGGAQQIFDVRPDLTTFGKVIGGGLPIGAWGGSAAAMDHYDPRRDRSVPHPGTFNGNALSMVAGIEAITRLDAEQIEHINALGQRLRSGIEAAAAEAGVTICVTGMGSMAQIHFSPGPITDARTAREADRLAAAAMHLALINEGVFTSPTCRTAICTPMTEVDVDDAVSAAARAFQALSAPVAA